MRDGSAHMRLPPGGAFSVRPGPLVWPGCELVMAPICPSLVTEPPYYPPDPRTGGTGVQKASSLGPGVVDLC